MPREAPSPSAAALGVYRGRSVGPTMTDLQTGSSSPDIALEGMGRERGRGREMEGERGVREGKGW